MLGELIILQNSKAVLAIFRQQGCFGDLHLHFGSFIEQDAVALREGFGEERNGIGEVSEGAGGDDGLGRLAEDPAFDAIGNHGDVAQAKGGNRGGEKSSFLLPGFDECELCAGQNESEGNAGESGTGAGVHNVFGGGEEQPGPDGIGDVFDGRFVGAGDAGEVELLVGLGHESQVVGGSGDAAVTVGEVEGEGLLEVFGKDGFRSGLTARHFEMEFLKDSPHG